MNYRIGSLRWIKIYFMYSETDPIPSSYICISVYIYIYVCIRISLGLLGVTRSEKHHVRFEGSQVSRHFLK